MKVAFSPIYKYRHLPVEHRFPMIKYELLPMQLLHEGIISKEDFFHPKALSEAQILRTHSLEYWSKLKNGSLSQKEIRAMGFPFHPELVTRGRHIAHGTLECAFHAMETGVSLNIAGGTHHAYRDRGEGFCMFNDFAIASNELLHSNTVSKILIIDLDVHQGNGNAKIFENDSRVFTFSMHGQNNYPLRKEQSDLDIGLPDGIEDKAYLTTLVEALESLQDVKPDLVFYLSGVDILKTDKLGKMCLSIDGIKKRDHIVFEFCKNKNIPVAVSMGGGYAKNIKDIIRAHANTFLAARDTFC
ncbi:MAG: histone deacetylase [Flavobacteriales bacterium]|nr:histone deacetylase [Flavobacteriales bacterium]